MRKGKRAKELQTSSNNKKKKRISKNTSYKIGKNFEFRVKYYYQKQGHHAKRSYGSKGPYDVVTFKAPEDEHLRKQGLSLVNFIQCKNLKAEKPLSKTEKDNLKNLVKIAGGKALHVFNRNHKLVIEEIS